MEFKLLYLFLIIQTFGFSQLSNSAEISIITSGAGDGLYEKFGHTAIRINDKKNGFDEIYNYGMFDFNQPNFYWNFTRGFMNYKLARYPFYISLQHANKEGRWVKEQILNLNQNEKNEVFNFLENNLLPENTDYLYDPFFDNCATRPRDIILNTLGDNFNSVDKFYSDVSFRRVMNDRINQNTWGSFGINIALGSPLDRKMESLEYLYLPDYLFELLAHSTINRGRVEEKMVKKTNVLLDFVPKTSESDVVSPLLVFSLLFLLVLFVTYRNYKNNKRSRWIDFTLFLATGLAGCLFIFLWFFTNHSTAPNNFNVLWGFAPNIIIAFLVLRNHPPKWLKSYVLFLLILLLIIPIVWFSGVQVFSYVLIPLLGMLFVRYFYLKKVID